MYCTENQFEGVVRFVLSDFIQARPYAYQYFTFLFVLIELLL